MGIIFNVWYCSVTDVAGWPSVPVTAEYDRITGNAVQVVRPLPSLLAKRSSSKARLQVLVVLVVVVAVWFASVDA